MAWTNDDSTALAYAVLLGVAVAGIALGWALFVR